MCNLLATLKRLVRNCNNIFQGRRLQRLESNASADDSPVGEKDQQLVIDRPKQILTLRYRDGERSANRYFQWWLHLKERTDALNAQFSDETETVILDLIEQDLVSTIVVLDLHIISHYRKPRISGLFQAIVAFTQRGGKTIFAVDGTTTRFASIKNFFPDVWGLPWMSYGMVIGEFFHNKDATIKLGMERLHSQHYANSYCLQKVPWKHLLYYTHPGFDELNRPEILPEKVPRIFYRIFWRKSDQASAALTRHGHSIVAWIGSQDVSNWNSDFVRLIDELNIRA